MAIGAVSVKRSQSILTLCTLWGGATGCVMGTLDFFQRLDPPSCSFTGLREAVHSLTVFDVDMTMMHEGSELIFSHDGLGNDGDGDPHIFLLIHGRV